MKRIKHVIRSAYGYTDRQILDHIVEYGGRWAIDAYRMIQDDKNLEAQMLISIMPVARSPQTKKGGREMSRYIKDLRRGIERGLSPWVEQERIKAIKERMKKEPHSMMYDDSGNLIDLENGWEGSLE